MKSIMKNTIFAAAVTAAVSVNASLPISNIKQSNDSTYQKFHLSIVPYYGFTGDQNDNVKTNISVNILGGLKSDVRSVEVGGFINIIKNNVHGVQVAGTGNVVLGEMKGLQVAGTVNMTTKMQGLQVSGVINSAKEVSGMQIAGVLNNSIHGSCAQIAGEINIAIDSAKIQIAGIGNFTPKTPFQLSGCLNVAKKVNTQISGCVNVAGHASGLQLGVLNFADSCSGIPIGVLSFVKRGYHKLEISGDELFNTNIAFRTGVNRFHTIVIAGMQPKDFEKPLWTYGFGMGSLTRISKSTFIGTDMTFQNIVKEGFVDANCLGKVGLGIEQKLFGKTSIYGGVTYNVFVIEKRESKHAEMYTNIIPSGFQERDNSHFNMKRWVGFKVGLRFF